jgi:hypothetical protein
MRADLAQLSARWRPTEGQCALREALGALHGSTEWGSALEGLYRANEVPRFRDLRGAPLSHADLRAADLAGASLVAADLSAAVLDRADLSCCNLALANLTRSSLRQVHAVDAVLVSARAARACLQGARLDRADASWAQFVHADLRGSTLVRANFSGATLTGSRLCDTIRLGWVLQDVRCEYAYWDREGVVRSPGPDRPYRAGEFEALHADRTSVDTSVGEFQLLVDPGTAPAHELADLLQGLSELYRSLAGAGLSFTVQEQRPPEPRTVDLRIPA